MMNVSALTPGINAPSSRFRVRQYISELNKEGIVVHEMPAKIDYAAKLPGVFGKVRQKYIFPISASWIGIKVISRIGDILKSNQCDLVWLNRIIVNLVFLERLIRKPLIYDVDDAIWINNEKLISKIGKKATCIIAGNSYIADWFKKFNNNVYVVPTAVDTDRFIPAPSINKKDKFIIGWTGSSDGLKYLYEIEDQLAEFVKSNAGTFLKIICNKPPTFKNIHSEKIIFRKWNPLTENSDLEDLSIGIMPLTDDEWSKGKCSFKMLQYMATGIPVVVSDVGMNSEILAKSEIGHGIRNNNEWQAALASLLNDPSLREKMGNNGRYLVEKEYSVRVVVEKLARIFSACNLI